MATSGLIDLAVPNAPAAPTQSGGIMTSIGTGTPANTTGPSPTLPVDPISSYTPTQATGVTAGATGYTSTPYSVSPDATVAEQVKKITSGGSPLMQLADSRAMAEMNSRGLMDSSISQGAREAALISAALPIAQQDAATHFTADTKTSDADNAAKAANAQAANNASSVNAQLLTSLNTTNANAINSALSQTAQAANQRALQSMSSNTQIQLANLQSQNQQLLQTNVNAANGFSQLVQQIGTIMNNAQLDQNAKQTNVQSLINNFNQFLKTTAAIASTQQQQIEDLNLDQYFNNPSFTNPAGTAPGAFPSTSGTTVGSGAVAPASQPGTNTWPGSVVPSDQVTGIDGTSGYWIYNGIAYPVTWGNTGWTINQY